MTPVALFRTPQVVVFSDDVERLASFYVRLGFAETFRVPERGDPIHVDVALDGYPLGIASVDSTREDHGLQPLSEGRRAAVVLWTDDVRSGLSAVIEAGGTELAPPYEWLGRLLIAWASDPDGNPVQVVQRA